jgi:hypothetical protein
MTIEGIFAHEIDEFWEKVEPLVERAMEYADGKMNAEDVYNQLKSKELQLWLVPGGIWVTRIVNYPRSTRLEWIAAAGEYQEWTEHLPILFKWAKAQGCDAAEIGGRAGWGKKTGFEEIHRVFRVKL